MTKKEFWIVLIKVFALYSIINLLFTKVISNIWYMIVNISLESSIWLVVNTILPIILFFVILFNAETIAQFLRLDKESKVEKIQFSKLGAFEIVRIATFIIGGLLFIENFPSFLNNAFVAFSGRELGDGFLQPNSYSWSLNATNIVIGCLLMMYRDSVAKIITKKSRDQGEDLIDQE